MRVDQKTETVNKNSKKHTIHNVFILDCSGSMYYSKNNKYSIALSGINEELAALSKETNVDYTVSLVEFGSRHRENFTRWMQPDFSLLPSRYELGKTALHDAIGTTLTKLLKEKQPEDRVLVKIFTDGEENDSIKFTSQNIKELIKTCEENNFTITFIGTEKDTKDAIKNYGLSEQNTLTHDNTPESIRSLTNTRIDATILYSKEVAENDIKSTSNFYNKKVNS